MLLLCALRLFKVYKRPLSTSVLSTHMHQCPSAIPLFPNLNETHFAGNENMGNQTYSCYFELHSIIVLTGTQLKKGAFYSPEF